MVHGYVLPVKRLASDGQDSGVVIVTSASPITPGLRDCLHPLILPFEDADELPCVDVLPGTDRC
jgi:hypothetical protein